MGSRYLTWKGQFLGVVRSNEKYCESCTSVRSKKCSKKINNGSGRDCGSQLQCSTLLGVTLHCTPWKICFCDTAFLQNYLQGRGQLPNTFMRHAPLVIMQRSSHVAEVRKETVPDFEVFDSALLNYEDQWVNMKTAAASCVHDIDSRSSACSCNGWFL